jgi:hypothetical protein
MLPPDPPLSDPTHPPLWAVSHPTSHLSRLCCSHLSHLRSSHLRRLRPSLRRLSRPSRRRRLPCPYRRAGGGAERAIRPLCSLVCAGTSTRRDLRCKVSRSRRVCPASQPTCSRTHASPALGRRHLIGAMVNTRSISSSASAAAPSPPRQLPPRHPAPCSRRPRGAAARGQRLAGGRACARRSARRREAVSGGVRSPCRGGRSSCGRPLCREPMRRGRRQGGPVGWPRRAHCGAFSGARTDATCVDRCRMRGCCSVQ